MNAVQKFALPLLCLTCAAQQGPVIRTETRTVLVETVVTGKKGEFVKDLAAKDFHILQDGKEQVITSLSAEAKSAENHFLVLFFDDTKLTAGDQFQARQAASRFIDANAGPHESMAIVNYDGALRVAQNFTDDAGRLKDALNRTESSTRVSSPSLLDRASADSAASSFGSRDMLGSLSKLVKEIGVLPGRKTVVLVSGGTNSSTDLEAAVLSAVEAANKSGVAIYPVDVRLVVEQQDLSSTPGLPRVGGRMRRGGGASGTDDSAASTLDPTGASQQYLETLANGTGGFFIRNAGEMLAGLERVGEEQAEYYVLSYTPPESKEGSCHALKVKVDRAGTTVRARSSYCATPPQDLIAGSAEEKDLESRAAGGDAGNLKASIELPYFYASAGVARVHVAMELSRADLKFENQGGKLHAGINLLGAATAMDGSIGARFSDTLKVDYSSQEELEKLKGTPVHYEKEFKIAPGTYNFTLTFSAGAASFGKIETPLEIEPWNGGELALSGLVLSRETRPAAADPGLLSSLVQDQAPLVAQGTQFIPAGAYRFAKSDTGYFYLQIYDAAPDSVRVRVRVVDRKTGEAKWDSGLTKPPPAEGSAISAGSGLRIGSLGAGSYRLEVVATDSAGKQVERSADFQVD